MQNPYLWAVWCPPGGFIASWALGTCPQRCHVSLFGSSTLREKSVPWQSTPNSAAQWVKSQERPCFFLCFVIYRSMFFYFCVMPVFGTYLDCITGHPDRINLLLPPKAKPFVLRESLKQHFPEAQDVCGPLKRDHFAEALLFAMAKAFTSIRWVLLLYPSKVEIV